MVLVKGSADTTLQAIKARAPEHYIRQMYICFIVATEPDLIMQLWQKISRTCYQTNIISAKESVGYMLNPNVDLIWYSTSALS
mmetsp:Transcript_15342/g.18111  ORF Transcript_15342/g.18111 Transcript_15342/m.18111 type:complete len:83 (-) Transcript_15342:199-447(-)